MISIRQLDYRSYSISGPMLKQKGRLCIPNVYTCPVGITTERFGSSALIGSGVDDDEHTTRNGNYGDGDEIHLEDLCRRI